MHALFSSCNPSKTFNAGGEEQNACRQPRAMPLCIGKSRAFEDGGNSSQCSAQCFLTMSYAHTMWTSSSISHQRHTFHSLGESLSHLQLTLFYTLQHECLKNSRYSLTNYCRMLRIYEDIIIYYALLPSPRKSINPAEGMHNYPSPSPRCD